MSITSRLRRCWRIRVGAAFLAVLIAACGSSLDWRDFRSEDGRFSIAFPGRVTNEKRTLTTPSGSVIMHMDSASVGDALFAVGYADYPADYLARVKPETIVNNVRDALIQNIGGRSVIESPLIQNSGGRTPSNLSGRILHAEGRSSDGKGGHHMLTLDAQLLFAGGRFYQVVVIGETGHIGKDALELYFSSFRIIE